jgi:AraC family transcriptional regulator
MHPRSERTVLVRGTCRVTEAVIEPRRVVGPHTHDEARFTFVTAGSYKETVGDVEWACRPLGIVLMPAGVVHADALGGAPVRIVSVAFDRTFVELDALGPAMLHPSSDAFGDRIARIHADLQTELTFADEPAVMAIEALCYEALACAMRARTCRGASLDSRLADVELYLRSNVARNVTLADVAGRFEMSPSQLARSFRRRHGAGIGAFVRRMRIEMAMPRLRDGREPLPAIAADLGFCDASHFTRVFKSVVGVPPIAIRGTSQSSKSV